MPRISVIGQVLPELKKRKRVAAYARVSMETEMLLHSLSAQVSHYNGLIQKNPDWEFAGIYADEGISGRDTSHRDDFNRLLADCDAGKIDMVLVKSVSRFARDTVETCVLLSRKKSSGKSTKIEIEIDLSEADKRECIGTATYQEIKDYVWEHYQAKVSHLYIAQIKKKCGLDVGENFNKPKTEGNKVPTCPPEKERMIREALEYFGMINKE